jgi:hypothetical protein
MPTIQESPEANGRYFKPGVFNLGLPYQADRLVRIAEYIHEASPDCMVLPELVDDNRSKLLDELNSISGGRYDLETINSDTQGHPELAIGVLTTNHCHIIGNLEAKPSGKKVRRLAAGTLAVVLGDGSTINISLVGVHLDWLLQRNLEEQIKNASMAAEREEDIAAKFIVGDNNSSYGQHNPIFEALGYKRLSPTTSTWPNPAGLNIAEGILDRSVAGAALLLNGVPVLRRLGSTSMDAIYGRGLELELASSRVYNGQNPAKFPVSPSDHFAVVSRVRL